jgi:2-aminoethylphosphonate-pyruvate transaminase
LNSLDENDKDVLVIDGDLIFHKRIAKMLANEPLKGSGYAIVKNNADKEAVKVKIQNGTISEIGKSVDSSHEAIGFYRLSKDGIDGLFYQLMNATEDERHKQYEDFFGQVISNGFYALDCKYLPCIEIDTWRDLKKAKKIFTGKLFTVGPVMMSDRVREALSSPDVNHREQEFRDLHKSVKEKVHKLVGAKEDQTVLIFNGSGTIANEAIISALPIKSLLVISNGEFGERLAGIAKFYNTLAFHMDFEWGKPFMFKYIEDYLAFHTTPYVAMVYHETSTSMINDYKKVSELCKKYGKILMVDTISAIGGEPYDASLVNITTGASNKAIGGAPVLSFACFDEGLMYEFESRVKHLDLIQYYVKSTILNETPNTPPIPLYYAFNAALNEVLEEGLDNRIKRYRESARYLRRKLGRIGMSLFVPEKWASSLSTIVMTYYPDELRQVLKDYGMIVCKCKGILEGQAIQIGTMGKVDKELIDELVKVIACELKKKNFGNGSSK